MSILRSKTACPCWETEDRFKYSFKSGRLDLEAAYRVQEMRIYAGFARRFGNDPMVEHPRMKDTLFELPPPNKTRLQALKETHGIETHHADLLPKDHPWSACHMPSARELAAGYDETVADIGEAAAKFCRLLDEQGLLVTGETEADAVITLCRNLNIPCVL